MALLSTTLPMAELTVSMEDVSAEISIDCVESPICSTTSIRACCWTSKVTPVRTYFLNPETVTSRLYPPGCRESAEYFPEESERTSVRVFVPELTRTTRAWGTTAPDESLTVPVMPPVNDCANVGNASAQAKETNERILYIFTPPMSG